MTLKILICGCLVLASLVAAERYGVSRGRQEGFGGYGGHGGPGGHGGGGFGGHGQSHGHGGPNHGFGHGGHGGHGRPGDFHHCVDCQQPPHDHRHPQQPQFPNGGHDHRHPQEPHFPAGHDHRHPQEPKQPQHPGIVVNFIIHEPEGMEVWIVQQSDIVFFGIELYVNNEPTKVGAVCDVCTNTTAVTNGKFIIENPDVIVKKGDVLHYYVLIGNGHTIVRRKLQILHVSESIISKCNCPGTSDIEDIDIRFGEKDQRASRGALFTGGEASVVRSPAEIFTTTLRSVDKNPKCTVDSDSELCPRSKDDDETDGPQREIQILEHIVEHMKVSCSTKPTNKLVLLKQAPFAAMGEHDLEKFVKSYFVISLELQKLGGAIRQVVPANPSVGQGIEFEMESYVDKQRVLYYTRVRVLEQIVDPDFTENGY